MEQIVKKDYQVRCPQRTEIELSDEVKAIDKKLQESPNDGDLWMERGLALSKQKLMREAVEAYSKAISIDPFKGIYYRHRGHRHLSCWEFQEACADFETASRMIPENWDVWYHLGLSYFLLGEYEAAVPAYRRCMEVTKTDGQMIALCDWYWRTLMRLGRKEDAEKVLENINDHMDYIEGELGYYYGCLIYKGLRNPEDFIERSKDYQKDATIMAYSLSNYYRVTGNPQKADELLEDLLKQDDTEIWAYFGYLAAVAEGLMGKK